MTNAESAKAWSLAALKDKASVAKHFAAVSTNKELVEKFGIDTANMFGLWDWVGGRALLDGLGRRPRDAARHRPGEFRALLDGFRAMDEHFRTTPFDKNLPVVMGLLSVWYGSFFGAETVAVLPYDQYLKRFPAYLQQLTMESNGKRVTLGGNGKSITRPVPCTGANRARTASTASINSSTRGTKLIPCDFIAFCKSLNPVGRHHDLLMANVFAQAEAPRVRQDRGASEGGEGGGCAGAAQDVPRQPAIERALAGEAHARSRWVRWSRCVRAHRVHAGCDLGHWLVRPVGRGVGPRRSRRRSCRNSKPRHPTPTLKHDTSTNALIKRYRAGKK